MSNRGVLIDLIKELREKNIRVGFLSHYDADLDEYLEACDNAEATEETIIDFIKELDI